ncbi:MAG: hypothetical protein US68_C0004G0030 [Candidatus Shapirobacteria bacterium GW2011_GWE1_38_10]|uniref:Integral membrane protein n=1 Tax=Candidatus Shapirobacteria bacterium GW2011_GWE1_38_10 TaxID=1618488 RepID=A0A0G0I5D0_9BACT|nr:MAG: hypothetical protein US46_C0005G0046 [Candidatus Shapirobacteria bacterium GW2011_GWF2_37_20]KKQ50548.1 MAG: hypothetical protein US68_C0004G0030 [Candidatus Shapirobacteria bacterium GW2011_GWE1_38_10]KKQ64690.1 MAG: hypothetical protein US85_C0005G0038 [Candidatus Shapirobacteria bacterium GW2011_GWF1_38_23]HBP51109.1 hypothetical protein [Candidatus Shapirobacteria bacterium]
MTNLVLAAVNLGDTPLGGGKSISQTYPDPASLITLIVKNGLTIAGIILIVLIIAGGFMMIASAGSGDQKKAATGKTLITDALIGFLVIFLSYFIIQIVEVITGLSIL